MKFGFIAKHRGDLGRGLDAGRSASRGRLLCLADTAAHSTQPERRRAGRQGPGELAQRSNLWRQAGVV